MVIYPFRNYNFIFNTHNGWMMTSYLDTQKWFLLFLNLTKLFPDKSWLKFDTLVPSLLIIIFNSKNSIVWLMRSSIFSLFYFQSLGKLDMEVFKFWLFKELSILECFSTWCFKHAKILYVRIFKLQLFYDRVIGRFL